MSTILGRDIAAKIVYAHDEIKAARELLAILKEAGRGEPPDFRDAFGRRRGLQLGVPSGESSRRLFDVDPQLAEIVIEAHIKNKQDELAALSVLAGQELEDLPQ